MKCSRRNNCHPDAPYPGLWEREKPEVCEKFPQDELMLKDMPRCSYYFVNGERRGECNNCGDCCVNIYLPEFNAEFNICPYLEV